MSHQAAERLVFTIVQDAKRPTSADALYRSARARKLTETEARHAIWRLIDQRRLRLTPERLLTVVNGSSHGAATPSHVVRHK